MADGYRVRSDEIWARVRADYLDGVAAEEVCRRHDVGLSALRHRARNEGWRKADQPRPPVADDLDIFLDLDAADLIETARLRLAAAVMRGQSGEAARWRRILADLRRDEDEAAQRALDRALRRPANVVGPAPKPVSVRPAPPPALQAPAPPSELHQLHSNSSNALPEPPPSRQVRRRMEREAARRS